VTASAPKTVAVGLFSGGLDSALAVKIILEQGVAVIGYYFRTPFLGGGSRVERLAERLGIELVVDEAGDDYIEMLKAPRFGRGVAFNPCVNCHIFMLRRAGALVLERGASFCFTGEVLGQRPMSQRRHQLELIEKEAGLEGKLLRPLSARLLPPTEAEEEGLVDRAALLGLEGRSRKTQLALAAAYGITGYSSPAGGCLLPDKNFGARLADAFAHGEDRPADIALLKIGRHFRLPSGAKAVVGRNEGENEELLGYLDGDAAAFEVEGVGSPITLLRPARREDWPRAAALTLRYSDARDRAEAPTRVRTAEGEAETITARAGDAADAETWRVGGGPEPK
jgi:tRNA-specific 2-thiouridylase